MGRAARINLVARTRLQAHLVPAARPAQMQCAWRWQAKTLQAKPRSSLIVWVKQAGTAAFPLLLCRILDDVYSKRDVLTLRVVVLTFLSSCSVVSHPVCQYMYLHACVTLSVKYNLSHGARATGRERRATCALERCSLSARTRIARPKSRRGFRTARVMTHMHVDHNTTRHDRARDSERGFSRAQYLLKVTVVTGLA